MLLVNKARREPDPRPEPTPLTPEELRVQRIVKTATGDLETAAMSNAVHDALATRNFETVVNAFPWDQTAETLGLTTEVFGEAVQNGLGTGFPKVSLRGRFDYTDPRSIEWAKTQSATLVTNMTEAMQLRVREVMSRSFTNNLTVVDTAKELRTFINLTTRQEQTLSKFITSNRDRLYESGLRGKELESKLSTLVDKQRARMISQRSKVIARQEIAMAEANGRHLGFAQAVEQGWAHPKSMKRWSASSDERTCEICGPMNGKSVQWNQPFPNGVYSEPAHILCRCTTSLLEPDSALAQSFMEPAPIAPPVTTNTLIPALSTIPIGNLRGAQEAIDDAHTRASGISTFQYDAGQIENLNVAVEPVIFNGAPFTEVRFKLTSGAKTRLSQAAEKSFAKDDGVWDKADAVALIDRKVDKKVTFAQIPKDPLGKAKLQNTMYNRDDVGSVAYWNEAPSSRTFTTYKVDGTAIRFVTSKDAFAYDGQVRVMIPGKATPAQIDAIMKDLGVTATRLPSEKDIELLKKGQLISLFRPNFGNILEKMPIEIEEEIARITSKWAFTLDEITTEIDSDGALRFLLPERIAQRMMDMSGVKSITHALGNYFDDLTQDEKTQRVVAFFSGRTKLLSNVQRKSRGYKGEGISETEDVITGGADYVFVRPSTVELDDEFREWAGNIVYEPTQILRRMDWFGYSGDSYGVKNPQYMTRYYNGKSGRVDLSDLNYIDEITNPSHRSEIMLRDSLDSKDIYSLFVDVQTRGEAIDLLRGLGITEWNGRKIEDVIVLGKGHG